MIQTAKVELNRKNNEIKNLRAQLDSNNSNSYRRNVPQNVVKRNKYSQTDPVDNNSSSRRRDFSPKRNVEEKANYRNSDYTRNGEYNNRRSSYTDLRSRRQPEERQKSRKPAENKNENLYELKNLESELSKIEKTLTPPKNSKAESKFKKPAAKTENGYSQNRSKSGKEEKSNKVEEELKRPQPKTGNLDEKLKTEVPESESAAALGSKNNSAQKDLQPKAATSPLEIRPSSKSNGNQKNGKSKSDLLNLEKLDFNFSS